MSCKYISFQKNGTGNLKYAMSFLPLARGSATLEYFYTITGEKNTRNSFRESKRKNGENNIIGDDYTAVVAMDLGNFHHSHNLKQFTCLYIYI